MPKTGFEPVTPVNGYDRSANCATTTAYFSILIVFLFSFFSIFLSYFHILIIFLTLFFHRIFFFLILVLSSLILLKELLWGVCDQRQRLNVEARNVNQRRRLFVWIKHFLFKILFCCFKKEWSDLIECSLLN